MWRSVLVAGLLSNGAAGFAYRYYRYRRGGPLGDVLGQGILAVVLGCLALSLVLGSAWARWPALAYAVLFAFVVMPIWTLAVLIPLPPGKLDYAFTAFYWVTLLVIAAAALLM